MKKISVIILFLCLLSSCASTKETDTSNNTYIDDYSNETIDDNPKNIDINDLNDLNYNLSNDKFNYDKLLNDLQEFKVIDYKVDEATYIDIKLDHPEVFYTQYKNGSIIYLYTQEETSKYNQEFKELATSLVKTSDVETLRSIHDYIVLNYSYTSFEDQRCLIDYLNLIEGSGNCFGYSNSFHLLASYLGYNVTTIKGYANEALDDHSWNVVNLNNSNYLVDTTWDDPLFGDGSDSIFANFSRLHYFLVSQPDSHTQSDKYPNLMLKDYNYVKTYLDLNEANSSANIIQDDISTNYSAVYTYTLKFNTNSNNKANIYQLITKIQDGLDRNIIYYYYWNDLNELYLFLD